MDDQQHTSAQNQWPREKKRRFEELWEGKEDGSDNRIRLREPVEVSPARRRNRLFVASFVLSAIMLVAAFLLLLKIYFG
ncbi:MAG: hypothetical protein IKN84_06625 [Bacteroidales bacterium]|jgi:hypothetical protein|nr:hypothetical protein [Bacteroidales bacterium]